MYLIKVSNRQFRSNRWRASSGLRYVSFVCLLVLWGQINQCVNTMATLELITILKGKNYCLIYPSFGSYRNRLWNEMVCSFPMLYLLKGSTWQLFIWPCIHLSNVISKFIKKSKKDQIFVHFLTSSLFKGLFGRRLGWW